jgi:hypothetical protein
MAQRISTDDRRPPPLDTSMPRPSSAPHSGTPTHPRQHTLLSSLETTPEEKHSSNRGAPPPQPGHQRFVLTDPVAFRYLEEDPSTTVLERRTELKGYECYVVEQWTTSRTHPTFVITTYTGDANHVVVVGVLSVPTDERTWSPRMRVYFKALNQYHARRRETPLGIVMVTNLSGFPSSLTVIPVPDGDIRKHRFDFFVNEDLKRLGCSGRMGLTLTPPAAATVAKFHQLYRTSDKNDIYHSVIELIKLCQSALMLFDKLEIDYADGLLCDVTERAINDWWVEIGSSQYNIEPHDGILGPTTVAGLLGLLMGARNRLHAVNAPVAKDAFDVEAMKRGISHFQKQQRLPRTRRLDRQTLARLQKATQRAAEHGGWAVPKVIKNTAAELSGKGGEMVMDAVGRGRDKAGIAEIETCDIERFVQLVYGERPKWLWLGKPLKKKTTARQRSDSGKKPEGEAPTFSKNLVFKPDEHGGFTLAARKSTVDGLPTGNRDSIDLATPAPGHPEDTDTEEEENEGRFGGFYKRAKSDLKNEAKSGLGKFKGAVRLKSTDKHEKNKGSIDDYSQPTTPVEEAMPKKKPLFRRAQSSPTSSPGATSPQPQSPTIETTLQRGREFDFSAAGGAAARIDAASFAPEESHGRQQPKQHDGQKQTEPFPALNPRNRVASKESLLALPPTPYQIHGHEDAGHESDVPSTVGGDTVGTAEASIAGSIYNGIDLSQTFPTGPETEADVPLALRRTLSMSHYISVQLEPKPDDAYPRHLSFSLAEGAVLRWDNISPHSQETDPLPVQATDEEFTARSLQQTYSALISLLTTTSSWTHTQLETLHSLLSSLASDQHELENLYGPLLDRAQHLQQKSKALLREEKEGILGEGAKNLEVLQGRLEYEVQGLRSRIEEVEAGVGDFEKGVQRVEDRVGELESDVEGGKRRGWCAVM